MHETEDAKDSVTMLADLEPMDDTKGGRMNPLAEIEIDILRLLDELSADMPR